MSRKRSRWILAASTASVFSGGNRACLRYQALRDYFLGISEKKVLEEEILPCIAWPLAESQTNRPS